MKNRQFWTYLFFGFFTLIFQTASQANDSIGSTPGRDLKLEKTDSIRMKSEILKISPKKVSVEYRFQNEATKDLETIVAFPLSPYWNIYHGSAGGGESQFEDFTVSIDGRRVSYQTRSKVEHQHKDITEGLEKLGMPTDRFLPLSAIKPSTLEVLRKNQWYSEDHPDGDLNAVYTIQKTHYWKQNFPAQKDIQSLHSYSPQLGSTSGGLSFFSENYTPRTAGSLVGHLFFPKNFRTKGITKMHPYLPSTMNIFYLPAATGSMGLKPLTCRSMVPPSSL